MMHYRLFVALALFLLHLFGASLVSAQTDQIDNYIQFEMNKRQIPGLALVVIRDGEVIKMYFNRRVSGAFFRKSHFSLAHELGQSRAMKIVRAPCARTATDQNDASICQIDDIMKAQT